LGELPHFIYGLLVVWLSSVKECLRPAIGELLGSFGSLFRRGKFEERLCALLEAVAILTFIVFEAGMIVASNL